MALPKPRTGQYNAFQIYPNANNVWTLGDPEKLIWSSIKHLCAEAIINELLKETYLIKNKKQRSAMAFNIKRLLP
jgi:hypothetical protein